MVQAADLIQCAVWPGCISKEECQVELLDPGNKCQLIAQQARA